jgi:hypothetical protein
MNAELIGTIINAAAVVGLVGVTTYYAVQTRRTVKEMELTRESTVVPNLFLEVTTMGAGYPMPRVKNLGVGVALDLEIVFSQTYKDDTQTRKWQWQALAPGEYKQFFLWNDQRDPMTGHQAIDHHASVALSASYSDILGKRYECVETVDLAEYMTVQFAAEGVRGIGPQDELLRKLDEIRDALEKVAKGR